MRQSRHGWRHEPQPENVIRIAIIVCVLVIIILAAFALLGHG